MFTRRDVLTLAGVANLPKARTATRMVPWIFCHSPLERWLPDYRRTFDAWEAGGVRWKASGQPRRMLHCPACRRTTWHVVYRLPSR